MRGRGFGGRGFGGRGFGGPGEGSKPVEEGKEYEVKIDSRGNKGDGIAHIEGFVVFVPGASVGQTVKVKIKAVRRTSATAEIV